MEDRGSEILYGEEIYRGTSSWARQFPAVDPKLICPTEERNLDEQDKREGEERGNKREKRERRLETREIKDQKTNKQEKTGGIQSTKIKETGEHKTSITKRDCSNMTGNKNNKNTAYCHFLDGPSYEEPPKTTRARRRKTQEEARRQGARSKKEQSTNYKHPAKNTNKSKRTCQCFQRPIKKTTETTHKMSSNPSTNQHQRKSKKPR